MKIDWIAGTGGIGRGEIFRLIGNHTLGREESRSAYLTGYKDYCKAHIILSYVAKLFEGKIPVYAVGMVGNDERGKGIKAEMQSSFIKTDFVREKDFPTTYSVCFLYEDGNGGNITTCNDASSKVTAKFLIESIDEIVKTMGYDGMFLGAPEVPLSQRAKALEYAKSKGIYTVCSVLSGEAKEFLENNYAKHCDLLAVNIDEITAIGKGEKDRGIKEVQNLNPSITLVVTDGKNGVTVYEGQKTYKIPAIKVEVVSTAGAGDALLGGTMYGLANGLKIEDSVKIGAVCSSFAVESAHTIPENFSKEKLERRIKEIIK